VHLRSEVDQAQAGLHFGPAVVSDIVGYSWHIRQVRWPKHPPHWAGTACSSHHLVDLGAVGEVRSFEVCYMAKLRVGMVDADGKALVIVASVGEVTETGMHPVLGERWLADERESRTGDIGD
jgi:hypothetical protein